MEEKLLCRSKFGEIFLTSHGGKTVIKKIDHDRGHYEAVKRYDACYDHEYLCRILAFPDDGRTILMEYVEGVRLDSVEPFEQRCKIAAAFFKNWMPGLHRWEAESEKYLKAENAGKLPKTRYEELLEMADHVRSRWTPDHAQMELMSHYQRYIREMSNGELYLLHGDVRAVNMIVGSDGRAKLVDLSPQIADRRFEYVKFFEDELYPITDFGEMRRRYVYMAEAFDISSRDFAPILYVDSCYRMWDTLYVEGDGSELEHMKLFNKNLLKIVDSYVDTVDFAILRNYEK